MLTPRQAFDVALTHHRAGRYGEAASLYRQLVALDPAHADAWLNLGIVLAQSGGEDEACTAFETVLRLRPGDFMANNNIGLLRRAQGRFDEAMNCFRAALEREPHRPEVRSNLIFTALFHPTLTPEEMDAELRAWNRHHAVPLTQPHGNDRSPDRRLRVGYVSPDFRDHVIGRNVLPLLREHDRAAVEVVCFSDVTAADAITARFRALASQWHDVAHLTHEQLAGVIRRERIDVLVDLTQHLARNRLPVFAHKPAPVQVSFAGYPASTGVGAIDHYFTDPHLGAVGADAFTLPDTYWCFDPLDDAPAVGPLPAKESGRVTFGCLNDPAKVNDRVLALWSRVLDALPGARLLARGSRLDHPRMEAVPRLPRAAYLAMHHQLDIALDTFPYPGHTTSCEALWMGVPVVSLAGPTPISRGGLSILKNAGLPELAARNEEDYVRIAVDLSRDLPRLAALRAGLRAKMSASPLMDAPRFARGIENAYREMWRHWCALAP
ncbi:MAG: tetratricopeptide repeat protein [Chthoniobacteraceae bacterium]